MTGGHDSVNQLFADLENAVKVSGEQLKTVFKGLGIDIPNGLINNLAQKTPEVQSQSVKTLISMKSGLQATSPELISLFSSLGMELPDKVIKNLSTKESPLQLETINLLGKIKEGHSVTEKELTSVFTNLGLTLPDTLISSMSSKKWRYASTGNRITQLDRFCGRVRTSWID